MSEAVDAQVGVVAIGRNEGDRLKKCLASAIARANVVVYVDSGSTDGSAEVARAMGAWVAPLDLATPFTAARARNQGLRMLREQSSAPFVQFVDGDCELAPGWIQTAVAALRDDPRLAVACGRRRERFPAASLYNRLCDLEWDTPVGQARACGGDALMRVAALSEVGGFDGGLIAGEEPELCYRLRQRGWTIARLDHEMTLHDAAMTRFSQWWRRSKRAGHAYAEHAYLHGSERERLGVHETVSNLAWTTVAGAAVVAPPLAPAFAGAVLATALKIWRQQRRRGWPARQAWLYAASCMASKIPQSVGAASFAWRRLARRPRVLIEYK